MALPRNRVVALPEPYAAATKAINLPRHGFPCRSKNSATSARRMPIVPKRNKLFNFFIVPGHVRPRWHHVERKSNTQRNENDGTG
jgi:hypothetical protein